jgi:hypothetical protein
MDLADTVSTDRDQRGRDTPDDAGVPLVQGDPEVPNAAATLR